MKEDWFILALLMGIVLVGFAAVVAVMSMDDNDKVTACVEHCPAHHRDKVSPGDAYIACVQRCAEVEW